MQENKKRILIVDDEEDIRQILSFNLTINGYQTFEAESVEMAEQLCVSSFDLLLLDIMLDGMDGISFAKKLRTNPSTADIPIIFISAKDTKEDIIEGLDIGADDYIAKPFGVEEVLARVKSVLRRTQKPEKDILYYKTLAVNNNNKSVSISEEQIPFTKIEFNVLYTLLLYKGKVFSRQDLLERIWPKNVIVIDRTVDVTIARIRKKLGLYAQNICTRAGLGYYFDD